MTDNRRLDVLLELEQVVEVNLNRHLATAKEWFPHEYVPWSRGRDFDGPLGMVKAAAELSDRVNGGVPA